MFSIRTILLVSLVSPGAAPSFADAGDPKDHRLQIDSLTKPIIDGEWAIGLCIGLIHEGGTEVYGYGRISSEGDGRPDGDTIFEIGSITKVFTGTILAEMVQRKLVDLHEPVKRLLPDSVDVPSMDDQEIWLLHLATHTSGLPRMPSNFEPKDRTNPYVDYSEEQLYSFLSGYELRRRPGEKYGYSNLGAGLLGHALARRAGKSYEDLLVEWIASPIGMENTAITLSEEMRSRLAQGHNANGDPVNNWDLGLLAGAGGIRSSVNDMVKFIAANLSLTNEKLAPAMKAGQMECFTHPGGWIGLGWHVRGVRPKGPRWHNGQTGGYHSFVGFDSKAKVGTVVLANSAVGVIDRLGWEILALLKGEAHELDLPETVPVSPERLDRYVGRYRLLPTFILTVTRKGERLFVQATGQQRLRVYPRSETEFLYRVVEARITFEVDPAGTVSRLILHQGDLDRPAEKIE